MTTEKKPKKQIVVFDLETTGVDPEQSRIVQFAGIKLGGDDLEEKARLELLVNPGVPIPPDATKVHGFTDDDVKRCPKFAAVARKIGEFIAGCDLAGHNAIAFDIPLLRAELERCGFRIALTPARRLFDTLELFRQDVPHTLAGAVRYYCSRELGDGAHNAMFDADACVDVLRTMVRGRDYDLEAMATESYGDRVDLGNKIGRTDAGLVFNFGKHAGELLADVARNDRSFLSWMLGKSFASDVKDIVKAALDGKLSK